MKAKRSTLIICMGVGFAFGVVVWVFGPHRPKAERINAALRVTMIPRLSVHGAFYSQAVDIVRRRLREASPELKQVPIICQLNAAQSPPPPGWGSIYPTVELDLHDIPADVALRFIAMQAGMGYAVRDGEIYLYSITWTDGEGYVPPLTRRERYHAYLESWYDHIHDDYLHLPP